jgi:hypothetical protein
MCRRHLAEVKLATVITAGLFPCIEACIFNSSKILIVNQSTSQVFDKYDNHVLNLIVRRTWFDVVHLGCIILKIYVLKKKKKKKKVILSSVTVSGE